MKRIGIKARSDDHIFDYSLIEDNIFVGSDLCKGKQCPIHSKEFNEIGVIFEINLKAESREIPPENIDSYIWIPVVDEYAPTQNQMDLGTSIIKQAVDNRQVVYVHCEEGQGRSPTLIAAYLIRYKNYNVEDAIRYLKERRPEVDIGKRQRKALDRYFQKWK